ncbi:MAG: hypothetical protein HY237_13020 [Acidobacteria bacterium]|nr:hypothetical protein [Acidobacteriota bacterium]
MNERAPEAFQRPVNELEAQGYVARGDSYGVFWETDAETGKTLHLHSMERHKADGNEAWDSTSKKAQRLG